MLNLLQANGTAEMSFISSMLGEGQLNKEEENDIKWTASSLYTGKSFCNNTSVPDAKYYPQEGLILLVSTLVLYRDT